MRCLALAIVAAAAAAAAELEPIARKGDRLADTFVERFGEWAVPARATAARGEASAAPMASDLAPKITHQRAFAGLELCAAHGMRRQYYRGKGGWTHWRCIR